MVDVGTVAERNGYERDRDPVFHAGLDGVGAGKAVEDVVEGAILLHDDHDVLDTGARRGRRSGTGGGGGCGSRNLGSKSGLATNERYRNGRKYNPKAKAQHGAGFLELSLVWREAWVRL
jgi:hypothetical protein